MSELRQRQPTPAEAELHRRLKVLRRIKGVPMERHKSFEAQCYNGLIMIMIDGRVHRLDRRVTEMLVQIADLMPDPEVKS